MKITAIDTIRLEEFPNLLWVQVHTDEGLVGLGETFMGPASAEAYIHEQAAHRLIGQRSAAHRSPFENAPGRLSRLFRQRR